MRAILKSLLAIIRRMLGVDHLTREIHSLSRDSQRRFLTELNSRQFQRARTTDLQQSALVERVKTVISLLSPADVSDASYVRVGRKYDGGYVMLDQFSQQRDGAYSFGISDDVSWDEQMAARGWTIYQYDHTIARLPKDNPRFRFFRFGICGFKRNKRLKTISECLIENGHAKAENLILKMDVEGAEWDVFDETPTAVIGQFEQIAMEMHDLTQVAYDSTRFEEVVRVLKKINASHQVVHVHANAAANVLELRSNVLPDLLEVTYVRRKDFQNRLVPNQRVFPTKLDEPTFPNSPDIYLGRFAASENELVDSIP